MAFSGLPFLLGVLPLVLAGCIVLRRFGGDWIKAWLFAASLSFYAIGAAADLPLLLASIAGNYLLLRLMHRGTSRRAANLASLGVAANLGLLCWFKFAAASGGLPLGISFFTFSQIGCLLYHADARPPPRPLDYALFAGFFPALVAGPVLNPAEVLPQFARRAGWAPTTDSLAVGLGFFVIGLLKKTMLADPLAPVVAAGFADPGGLTFLPAWQAACAYSLQLYFDFSGYTDMAIGLAWMVGLSFPDNFDQPYRARSVIAYWQCWHMSLTRFLMANVHAPLTLSVMRWRRRRRLPVDQAAQRTPWGFTTMIAAPIVATMLLVALWHGSGATFLLFGVLHAGFLLVNHAWRVYRGPALPAPVAWALTYLCVLTGAVVFRADTIPDALSILAAMLGLHGTAGGAPPVRTVWLLGLYALVWLAPTTRQTMLGGARFGWRPSAPWAMAMGSAATLGVLAAGGTGEFLYFRF